MSTQSIPRRAVLSVAWRTLPIVVVYVAVFIGLLPLLLWKTGARFDALFALPRLGVAARTVGFAMLIAGALLTVWAMTTLSRLGRGLPISHAPPTRLVVAGPYAVVRHPIYVAFLMAFIGAAAYSGSLGRSVGAGMILGAGSLIYAWGFEEPRLVSRFGRRYEAYRRLVPLLPLPAYRRLRLQLIRVWRAMRGHVERAANRPVLVRHGHLILVTYGVCAAVTTGLIATMMAAALRSVSVPPAQVTLSLLGTTLATALGSRAFWLGTWWRALRRTPVATLRRVGFISWGGFLGLFGSMAGCAYLLGVNPLWVVDAVMPFALAGQALNRFGCLTYGCCVGRPSSLGIRWCALESKVVRERGSDGHRRIPTQLLELALSITVLVVVLVLSRLPAPPGAMAGVALLAYGIGRIGIECLREEPRYASWQLTQGQFAAGASIVLALMLLLATPTSSGRMTSPIVLASITPVIPAVIGSMAISLGAFGLHWRRVGSW